LSFFNNKIETKPPVVIIPPHNKRLFGKMGDCNFNAGVIDTWHRETYQQRQENNKKDPVFQNAMKAVRRKHICRICKTYPGDESYTFGLWQKGDYTCFDCI